MKKLIATAAFVLCALTAYAAPVNIVFTSFNQGLWQLGFPYTATINGTPDVEVMCDDWAHGGLPGQTWQANYTDLGTGNLSLLRFNQLPNALTLYEKAGWLLLETRVTPYTEWTDINIAVWYTFDNSAPLTSGAIAWLNMAQQEANLGFPGVNFHDVACIHRLTSMIPILKALRNCASRSRAGHHRSAGRGLARSLGSQEARLTFVACKLPPCRVAFRHGLLFPLVSGFTGRQGSKRQYRPRV